MNIRKQFHFRPSSKGFFAWNVTRLIQLTQNLPIKEIKLADLRELDEAYWYGSAQEIPTVKSIAEHAKLMREADLNFPIILSADGRIMDGMHRVAKAYIEGHATIRAVQFTHDPEPDFTDVYPDELDYS